MNYLRMKNKRQEMNEKIKNPPGNLFSSLFFHSKTFSHT
jgi:hypothetical protein